MSVFAPDAVLASRSKCSSMCRVFFIHTIVPYQYGLHNRSAAALLLCSCVPQQRANLGCSHGVDAFASAAATSGSAPRSVRPGRTGRRSSASAWCSAGTAPSSPDIEQIDRLLPVGIDEFERDSKD